MHRRLWFGVAMISAFGSIYAGIFGVKRLQYALIVAAVVAVFLAFRADPPPPVDDPRQQP
jgi:hypothetical protein